MTAAQVRGTGLSGRLVAANGKNLAAQGNPVVPLVAIARDVPVGGRFAAVIFSDPPAFRAPSERFARILQAVQFDQRVTSVTDSRPAKSSSPERPAGAEYPAPVLT